MQEEYDPACIANNPVAYFIICIQLEPCLKICKPFDPVWRLYCQNASGKEDTSNEKNSIQSDDD